MILLRSAAFNVWFHVVTTAMCLAGAWPLWRARREGRAPIQAHARVWARLILFGLRALCGAGWRLDGAEHLPPPGQGAILAAQHQSTFETLLWALLLRDAAFVVKRELFAVPLFGGLLKAAGNIGVDRGGGATAMRAMLREARRAADQGRTIVIFPEGTRSPAGEVGALRPGVALLATRLGLPVIPVVTNSGKFWGRRAFRKFPGTILVRVLPALPPSLSRDQMLERLRVAFALGPCPAEPAGLVDNSVGRPRAQLSRGRSAPP